MSLPAIFNFSILKGDAFRKVLTLNNNETAFNLTGYRALGQIRRSYTSTTDIDFILTVLDPQTDGKIEWLLESNTSELMTVGGYLYDVVIEDQTSGDCTTILSGRMTVLNRVTEILDD